MSKTISVHCLSVKVLYNTSNIQTVDQEVGIEK